MSYGGYVGYATVLRQVNAARVVLGLEPLRTLPRGRREDHEACPLALAIDAGCRVGHRKLFLYYEALADVDRIAASIASAWGTTYEDCCALDGNHATVDLPPSLRRFVARFDAGELAG